MKTVFESSVAVDAHMILHQLQASGVEGQVLGEYLQGGIGELPAGRGVRVVVEDERESEARAIIEDWERRQPPDSSTDLAPGNRSHTSTVAAFVAGVLAGGLVIWWALRTPTSLDSGDMNGDGFPDMWTTYAGQMTVQTEYDRNADRQPDARVRYDTNGSTESISVDDDFDGRFELNISYRNDWPASSQLDRNNDGRPNVQCHYRLGVLASCDYFDTSGRLRKREAYIAGVLDSVGVDTDGDGAIDFTRHVDWMGEVFEAK